MLLFNKAAFCVVCFNGGYVFVIACSAAFDPTRVTSLRRYGSVEITTKHYYTPINLVQTGGPSPRPNSSLPFQEFFSDATVSVTSSIKRCCGLHLRDFCNRGPISTDCTIWRECLRYPNFLLLKIWTISSSRQRREMHHTFVLYSLEPLCQILLEKALNKGEKPVTGSQH